MKTKILFAAAAALVIVESASAVMADDELSGGGSWASHFWEIAGAGETSGGDFTTEPFDTIVVQMTSGGSFSSSPMTPFWSADGSYDGASSWDVTYINEDATYFVAKGDVVDNGGRLDWNFHFTQNTSFKFQYAAYLGDEKVLHQEIIWTGSHWTIEYGDPDFLPILIPLPAPLYLGAAGLGGVFLLRRRRTY